MDYTHLGNTGLSVVRDLFPPIAINLVRRLRNRGYGFSGDFPDFAAAVASSRGYESPDTIQAIVTKPAPAAGAEVDARLQQVLAALAVVPQRPLSLLDFGGSAGHYYDLLRPFLPVRWTVLETPAMVAANKHRKSDELRFTSSANDVDSEYDVVLMSGVLQCLETPHEKFEQLAALAPYILVNRLPLIDSSRDRLTVQRVHPSIGRGSYPAWFFARERFMATVSRRHDIVMRWDVPQDAPTLDGRAVVYKGLLLRAR